MAVLNGERMHDTMERLLPGARSAALLWQGAAALGGAALGAGQVYGGAAPFGLALVIGCPPSYCLAAALGTLAAGLAFQPMLLGVKLAVAAVAAAAVRRLIDGRSGAGALAGCLTLTGGAGAANRAGGGTFQPGADRHGGVYGAAGRGFWLGVRAFSGAGAARRLPVAGCGYGMLTALCRRALGSGPGAGRGGRAVRGHRRHAGADRRAEHCAGRRPSRRRGRHWPTPRWLWRWAVWRRPASARGSGAAAPGVFAAGCTAGALAAPDAVSVLPLAVSAGVGVVAALAVPGSVLHKIFPPPAPPVQTQGLGGAARKLSAVADTLSDIADTVNAVCQRQLPPKGETFDFVVEQVARTTCQSCTRRSRCWVRGYATAMDGLYHLKPTLESKGRVEVEDLPGQLAGCIHPADLCTAANHGYRLWRSRRQTRARAVTLRAALTEQYSALAGALAQLAGKLGQAGLPDPRREAAWRSCLPSWGWTRWNAV